MSTPARVDHRQLVHFLRKSYTFADDGVALTIGVIPSGALILKPLSGVHVTTVTNDGTAGVMDVGTDSNDDLFGTDLDIQSAADFVPLDEAIGGFLVAADTTITATVALTDGDATAGAGEVVIAYIPDTDG